MKIAELINKRWSPRAFEDIQISNDEAMLLFEAARWAPSSMNEQPWSYYYALKQDEQGFNKFLDCLLPGNKVWAKNASMLILSFGRREFNYKNRPNRHVLHDTGAANVLLALQAAELGFQAHQMGGFDMDKTYKAFNIDQDKYELASFIAIGKAGDPSGLPEDLRHSETGERKRKEKDEFVKRYYQ